MIVKRGWVGVNLIETCGLYLVSWSSFENLCIYCKGDILTPIISHGCCCLKKLGSLGILMGCSVQPIAVCLELLGNTPCDNTIWKLSMK